MAAWGEQLPPVLQTPLVSRGHVCFSSLPLLSQEGSLQMIMSQKSADDELMINKQTEIPLESVVF